ncbi:MAG: hypothetical protein MJE77_32900 [Proteobacteria bacterium]|nr:hypothetical protein [Pseudomonadota bacterium]
MTRWFSSLSWLVITVTFPLISACFGGESRPGPLRFHLDNMYIAQVPMEEQQAVFRAQTEFSKAKAMRAKARADLEQSSINVDIAKNETKQAILSEDSAKSRKDAAEKRGDVNEINTASLALRAAKLARQAADKKVEYMEARRAYLKEQVFYAEDEMYAKEAHYELTKARLAEAKNIRPQKFSIADYEKQNEQRSARAQQSRARLESRKTTVEQLENEWKRRAADARKAKGEMAGAASSEESIQ